MIGCLPDLTIMTFHKQMVGIIFIVFGKVIRWLSGDCITIVWSVLMLLCAYRIMACSKLQSPFYQGNASILTSGTSLMFSDSKVHGANMGPIKGLLDPMLTPWTLLSGLPLFCCVPGHPAGQVMTKCQLWGPIFTWGYHKSIELSVYGVKHRNKSIIICIVTWELDLGQCQYCDKGKWSLI